MATTIDEIGKYLFGRPARLAVCLYLARVETTYLSELAKAIDQPLSAVSQELNRLTRIGLLNRQEIEGSHRIYFTRTESPWWRVIQAAAEVADEIERLATTGMAKS